MKFFQRSIEIYRSEGAVSLTQSTFVYLNRTVQTTFGNYYRIKKHQLLYGDTAPSPYQTIHVDPDDIEYMIVPALRYEHHPFGTYILDGNWDRQPVVEDYFSTREFKKANKGPALLPFSEYGLYQSIRRHYLDDVPWEDTEWYQYLRSIIKHLEYDSENEVLEYFSKIDTLYNEINEHGYKSQRELQNLSTEENALNTSLDEVLIDIDRDGRFLFEDGRHRLSIAKVLGIEQIPVRVLVRHTSWQETRNRIASQDSTEDENKSQMSLNHPDLQNLL